MKRPNRVEDRIAQVEKSLWQPELEKVTYKYHTVAAWAAIIFDPIFTVTDYFNTPESWQTILVLRIAVAIVTLITVLGQKKFGFPSYYIVIVPFTLISLQNAFTYSVIGEEDLIGHNLNYIALLIGAAMFLAWESVYSVAALIVSATATAFFIQSNPDFTTAEFFVRGGLLLVAVGAFMYALIKTRYDLTVKEIKARLALQISNDEIHLRNEEIQAQAEKIKAVNDNLEQLVQVRTLDLEKKNKALEEYAFINAHKLRSPVASILGLVNLAEKLTLDAEGNVIFGHLKRSTENLDSIVSSITQTIEKADQ